MLAIIDAPIFNISEVTLEHIAIWEEGRISHILHGIGDLFKYAVAIIHILHDQDIEYLQDVIVEVRLTSCILVLHFHQDLLQISERLVLAQRRHFKFNCQLFISSLSIPPQKR